MLLAAETKAERNPLRSAISVLEPHPQQGAKSIHFFILQRLELLGSDPWVNGLVEVETKLQIQKEREDSAPTQICLYFLRRKRKQPLTSDFLEQPCLEDPYFVIDKFCLMRIHVLPVAGVRGGEVGKNIRLGANRN